MKKEITGEKHPIDYDEFSELKKNLIDVFGEGYMERLYASKIVIDDKKPNPSKSFGNLFTELDGIEWVELFKEDNPLGVAIDITDTDLDSQDVEKIMCENEILNGKFRGYWDRSEKDEKEINMWLNSKMNEGKKK